MHYSPRGTSRSTPAEQTMVRLLAGDRLPSPALRALPSTANATGVAAGPRERLVDAAAALRPAAPEL